MRNVNVQFWRICFVVFILVGMGGWQYDFVKTAVGANPALNLLIFGTCLFGFVLLFSAINSLRNEYRAFYALVETHDDLRNQDQTSAADPKWRYFRCHEIGIVFRKPTVLGQSYQMISDQLLRDKEMRISASTMATLIEGIDERLHEQKSLVSYVAGILIFLGLIGTFLGLMITLASVGDILGGLDLTSGDPTETVSALMQNLQVPLGGMATGFSSSLFGLITSLCMSIMIQLLAQAGGGLKSDFSDWLSNAVNLHDAEESAGARTPEARAAQIEERRLALLMRAARHSIRSVDRQRRETTRLADAVAALADEGRETRAQMASIARSFTVVGKQNVVLQAAFSRTAEAVQKISETTDMRAEVAELAALTAADMQARDARLAKALRHLHKDVAAALAERDAPARQDPLDEEARVLERELAGHADALNVRQINKLLAAIYRKPDAEPAPAKARSKAAAPARAKKAASGGA